MKNININEIRPNFLKFFKEKDHIVFESFSLIPEDDDSLLLVNAGMVPLKDYFTGDRKLQKDRAASCQKCIRTLDIDNVGVTARHATFFEMLGNFSFGDYFKKEAIEWSWEFLTEWMELEIDSLYISVYEEDDEAYDIWKNDIGIDEEHLIRLGKEHNFWELEVGPCGPSSEIYVKRDIGHLCDDPNCQPGCDCDRYLEVWNLVFTQFNKDENGEYHPLAHPNIDTGMGLERLAAVLQEEESIYDIWSMKKILGKIEDLSGKKYKKEAEKDVSFRIIGDHIKAIGFLVFDGVVPSNEGRGYILRRLIRRASRHGKILGIHDLFLDSLIDLFIEAYEEGYPELKGSQERIKRIVRTEEEQFQKTIDKGLEILNSTIEKVVENKLDEIEPEDAFKLYDTYGFPIDLTLEILEENGLKVSIEGFEELMKKQIERSRQARSGGSGGWTDHSLECISDHPETKFLGYLGIEAKGNVEALVFENKLTEKMESGQEGALLVDKSPFYGEGGGQVGDTGTISGPNGRAKVLNTLKNKNNAIIHLIQIEEGFIEKGDIVELSIDNIRRRNTIKNHTATHLLNQALRDVLGNHINQAGSLVTPDRLRFDITHFEQVSKEDLLKVQDIVNEKIADSIPVIAEEMSLEDSEKLGAIGLFEDKYQDIVRVLQIGDYSVELCGGTHVDNTSEIQMFKILHETSVAAGVRRIEAITGPAVYHYLKEKDRESEDLYGHLRARNYEEALLRVESLEDEIKTLKENITRIQQMDVNQTMDDILTNAHEIDGFKIAKYIYEDLDMGTLRNLADQIKQKLGSGSVVLANIHGDKVNFVSTVTDDFVEKGVFAGNLVREVAQITGGNGGGRKDFASAGGKDIEKVEEAMDQVEEIVESMIK